MSDHQFRVKIVDNGSDRYEYIDRDPFIVGRGISADVVIKNDLISRAQLEITHTDGTIWIMDLGSSNGTWIDNEKLALQVKTAYQPGQCVALGSAKGPFIYVEYLADSVEATDGNDDQVDQVEQYVLEEESETEHEEVETVQLEEQAETVAAEVLSLKDLIGRNRKLEDEVRKNESRVQAAAAPMARVAGASPAQDPRRAIAPQSKINKVQEVRPLPRAVAAAKAAPVEMPSEYSQELRIDQKISQAEKILFEQIKGLVGLEAEEIRTTAIEEAKRIRLKAESFANEIITDARKEAAQSLKESASTIALKRSQLKTIEAEAAKRNEVLGLTYEQLAKGVENLKTAEGGHRQRLSEIQDTIRLEEERIRKDKEELDSFELKLAEDRKKFDIMYENFQFEERKVRAKLETEMLEAKLKTTQIFADAEKVQALKEGLEPEVQLLKNDKKRLENELNEIQMERRREEYNLQNILKDFQKASDDLALARKNQENIYLDMDVQRSGLLKQQEEIKLREEESRKRVADAQVQAEETIARAKGEAYETITRAKNDSQETVSKARHEAQRIVEEAQTFSQQLLSSSQSELKELNAQRDELKLELARKREQQSEQLKDESRKLRDEHSREFGKLKKKDMQLLNEIEKRTFTAEKEYQAFVNKTESETQLLKEKAQKEAKAIQDEVLKYQQELKAKSDAQFEQLKQEIQAKRNEHNAQLQKLEEKKKILHSELTNLEAVKQQRMLETEEQLGKILVEGQQSIDQQMAQAQQDIATFRSKEMSTLENEVNQRRQDIKNKLSEAETRAKDIVDKAEKEAKESKQKLQNSLTELKHLEMANIKDAKRKAEEEIINKKSEKAREVSTNVYALVASELQKARNKSVSDEFIDTFSKELKELVQDTMLDKVSADGDRLTKILKVSQNSKEKEKVFWRKVIITGGSVALVLLAIIIFPGIITGPRDAVVAAFSDQGPGKSDAFVEKVKEARIRSIYNPATTVEYKESYVENVLYTSDFMSKKESQAYQDKWILELNDYFIRRLDVKDTTIIKFVSLETNLLRDLAKLKEQADATNPEIKISEMKAREKEFRQKLGEIFEDHGKVSRYYEYSEKFWNDFYHPRQLSH